MNFKIVTLIFLTLVMLSLACVSAADDVNETLTQNTDSPVLEESWNWTMDADDEIEIIPAQDQEIKIKNSPFTYQDNDYNYSLSIDDEEVNVKVSSDWVRFDASNLRYGSHKYELKFLGNNFYKPTGKIGVLNVTNIHVDIKDEITLIDYDDDIESVVKVSIQNNQSGQLSVYMDDVLKHSINVTANKDKNYYYYTFFSYDQLRIGNYTVRVVFNDTQNIFEKSKKVKVDYQLDYRDDFSYGDTRLYIITPVKNTPTVKVNGVNYNVIDIIDDDENRFIYIEFNSVLSIGDYPIEISYSGDSRYPAKTVKDILSVRSHITVSYYPTTCSIKLPDNAKGNLVVDIYDYDGKLVKTVKQKVSNGEAYLRLSQSGVYGKFAYAVAKYDGNDYEVKNKIIKDVTIDPNFNVPSSMVVGEKKTVSLNLPGKQGKLIVTAHGTKYKKYTANLVNGKASISLADLPAGKYTLSITFKETLSDGKTENYFDHYDLTVLDHINFVNPDAIYYGSAKIKLECYGENGKVLANKYLVVKINGKTFKKIKTDKKGVAYIKLSKKYTPKKYKITVTYSKYKTTKNIKVKQVLSFDKIKIKKSAKKLVFNVKLKKGDAPIKSKKITVKFNGKAYKVKTNKKGIAKVTVKKQVLKKLKTGKKITVKATYLKTSITKKVKVQK